MRERGAREDEGEVAGELGGSRVRPAADEQRDAEVPQQRVEAERAEAEDREEDVTDARADGADEVRDGLDTGREVGGLEADDGEEDRERERDAHEPGDLVPASAAALGVSAGSAADAGFLRAEVRLAGARLDFGGLVFEPAAPDFFRAGAFFLGSLLVFASGLVSPTGRISSVIVSAAMASCLLASWTRHARILALLVGPIRALRETCHEAG